MKAIAYCMMLLWCLYGIPQEEWYMMGDAKQDAVLDELAERALVELDCEEVELKTYIEGRKWVFIQGKCIEEKSIAKNKEREPLLF